MVTGFPAFVGLLLWTTALHLYVAGRTPCVSFAGCTTGSKPVLLLTPTFRCPPSPATSGAPTAGFANTTCYALHTRLLPFFSRQDGLPAHSHRQRHLHYCSVALDGASTTPPVPYPSPNYRSGSGLSRFASPLCGFGAARLVTPLAAAALGDVLTTAIPYPIPGITCDITLPPTTLTFGNIYLDEHINVDSGSRHYPRAAAASPFPREPWTVQLPGRFLLQGRQAAPLAPPSLLGTVDKPPTPFAVTPTPLVPSPHLACRTLV